MRLRLGTEHQYSPEWSILFGWSLEGCRVAGADQNPFFSLTPFNLLVPQPGNHCLLTTFWEAKSILQKSPTEPYGSSE